TTTISCLKIMLHYPKQTLHLDCTFYEFRPCQLSFVKENSVGATENTLTKMKVWVKPLIGERFPLEINKSDRVSKVKFDIAKNHSIPLALSDGRLIWKGKIIENDFEEVEENDQMLLIFPVI